MVVIEGKGVCGGIAFGKLLFYRHGGPAVRRSQVADPQQEITRFRQATEKAVGELDALHAKAMREVGEANAQIFEIHQMMLEDDDYRESVETLIEQQQVNAEYAVHVTSDQFADRFASMDDDYMKGRAADVRDVSGRLIAILTGTSREAVQTGSSVILAAEDLAPSETVQLDTSKIAAFVTQYGSSNSHTAILARTMNIPAVIGAGEQLQSEYDGKDIIVDGKSGKIYIEPDEETVACLKKRAHEEKAEKELIEQLKGKENRTRDGRQVHVFANIGSPEDLEKVLANDAGGIGLFRSEFLYLKGTDFPSEDVQFTAYKTVAEGMQGNPVIIRTLDIGADKQADYFHLEKEANPAMGYRAIRICLTRVELFKTQLRALLRASAFGKVAIMFPMITSVSEVIQIKKIVSEVKAELDAEHCAYADNVPLGIMIETPAAAVISDQLAREVDFFSIGTNDLTQYTLAIDRQNAKLDAFYDPHHLAILRLIQMTVDNAHKNHIWAGICGELGADLSLTETFLSMGVDELSVSPPSVLKLRKKIRETDVSHVCEQRLRALV